MFVGCVQGELDLEDLGGTQQQFLPLLRAPGAERVLAVAAAVCSSTALNTPRPAAALPRPQHFHLSFARLVGPLTPALVLVQVGGVAVLFGRVSLHIHGFVLTGGGRLGEGPGCSVAPAPF